MRTRTAPSRIPKLNAARQRAAVRPRAGGRPAQLSRDSILEHARQVPAHELTMPEIARRLGVKSAALYYHFDSRDALLAALGMQLAADFSLRAPDPARWRSWLLATVLDLHAFLNANPVILALQNWSQITRIGLPLIENMLATLEGAGFDLTEAMHVWSVVANYAYSNARTQHDAARFEPGSLAQAQADALRQIDGLPRTRAMVEAYESMDAQVFFRQSLKWLIDGLPAPRRTRTRIGGAS